MSLAFQIIRRRDDVLMSGKCYDFILILADGVLCAGFGSLYFHFDIILKFNSIEVINFHFLCTDLSNKTITLTSICNMPKINFHLTQNDMYDPGNLNK